jgi:hypothetical protein
MRQLDAIVAELDTRIQAMAKKVRGLTYPLVTGGPEGSPARRAGARRLESFK